MNFSKAHQLRGKGNKYQAQRVQCVDGGPDYRSKLEARVHEALRLMERAGAIKNIRREQTIQITPSMTHKLDFVVFDVARGIDLGVEVKGFNDKTWHEKQKCYRDFAVFPVQVWGIKNGVLGPQKEIPVGKFKIVEKEPGE